jgi:N-ethylmaleimide reductase
LMDDYFSHFRSNYNGRLMANLGFTRETGNAILLEGTADLVSFGAPFIANPDLVERFKYDIPLSEGNRDTYYTAGENGYTDYPKATHHNI